MQRAIQNVNLKEQFTVAVLTETIRQNKAKHLKELAEAKVEYAKKKVELAENIVKATAKFKKTLDVEDFNALQNAVYRYQSLHEPVDASAQYDKMLDIFAALSTGTVELGWADANVIINDEYEWAIAAKTANAFYSNIR